MNDPARPRSCYLHVPFCAHRCGYCNFTVIAGRRDLGPALVAAIRSELSSLDRDCQLDTVYIGGGTPTELPPHLLARLLEAVREVFQLRPGYEWTVEANPGDLHGELPALLASYGVTRVSLGVQSFHEQKLAQLERNHAPADIATAVEAIRNAGLQAAVDLIFAAPGEQLADWESDLHQAIALEPDHISTYGLTYEKGTTFWNRRARGELRELSDETQRSMYLAAIDRLSAAGLEHYEVSNFARPERRSRHNETYWAGREYFAAGPGAARYVDGVRSVNHRSTTTYLARIERGESPIEQQESLTPEGRAREMLVLGLRRIEGVERDQFAVAAGYEIDRLCGDAVQRFVEHGMLEDCDGRIRLTREGLLVSDHLWPEML